MKGKTEKNSLCNASFEANLHILAISADLRASQFTLTPKRNTKLPKEMKTYFMIVKIINST